MTKLATICYIDNGKEFLLLLRNKKPNDVHEGKYIGVGGKLEAAETPEECAVREIFEEAGLQATKMEMKESSLSQNLPQGTIGIRMCFV